VTKVQKIALLACPLLIFPIALAIRAVQNEPLPAVPVPAQLAPRAAIVLDKAPPAPPPEPPTASPVNAIVALEHSNDVLEMAASPLTDDLLVESSSALNSYGEPDDYGGVVYLVHLSGTKPEAVQVMSGNNINSASSPQWDPAGKAAYFTYDGGICAPMGSSVCGIFALDPQTGSVRQLLGDSTEGLSISADGSLLAFWDYTTGDKLTVFDVKNKTIVRAWAGEVHNADDLVVRDIAFAPDQKSIFALTYAPKALPLKQFDLRTSEVRTVVTNAHFLLSAADGAYFTQFDPVAANSTPPRALLRIPSSDSAPETLLKDFPYQLSSISGNGRWIVAHDWERGIAIYDTRDHTLRLAGKECQAAAVLPDGRAIYATRGQLISEPAACGLPPAQH
jgi:hypothetical protein